MLARGLLRRPDARAESVEDLVAKVLRGEVRIPVFQRGLKWDAKDVVDLFDSLYCRCSAMNRRVPCGWSMASSA